jgi:hypothetical protein
VNVSDLKRPVAQSIAVLLLQLQFAATTVAFGADSPAVPSQPAEMEITTIDLQKYWRQVSSETLPTSAYAAISRYLDKQHGMGTQPSRCDFVLIDLDLDGRNEIIVADPLASGSGGQAYFALRSSGKGWNVIGEFQGGLVLTQRNQRRDGDAFYQVISYYRSGDTYQNVYDFRNGRYRLSSQVIIPRAVSRSDWWEQFWRNLNSIQRQPELRHRG